MYDISIITVNYNSYDDTLKMIESVKNNTSVNYEMIVIDNASAYDEYLKLECITNKKNTTLYRSKLNVGFAAGNMLGIEKASPNSKYYFFLNNDTLLINNVVDILFHTMEQEKNIGLIAPQLYDEKQQRSTTFREFPSVSEKFFGKGFHQFISTQKIYNYKKEYHEIIDVGIVSGASLFCKAEAFQKAGKFDTNFFLYCEEEDLSKRIKDIGYRVCLEPNAKLIHLCGKSTLRNFHVEKEFVISYFYLVSKHHNLINSFLLKLNLTLKYLFKLHKDPIYKKLFLFCFKSQKSTQSLKYQQKKLLK